ncbi:MFS general substrate transporter [Dendrothele bispora CBS 962.96]|uniref:MFS general substrate transporter n=1 Tax=Dendrothele bispora (strain CBS 962.96) TaxID=1314807 RepID=A0A4S8MDB1_DENBC|nr:MFS general substrate transporter [Dendrothele bispora CBS 962.96]
MIINVSNTTLVSISLPVIARDLNIGQVELQWLLSGFALSSGCLLLICGRIADLYGQKKVFILGSLWLIVFSLGCGFAQNSITLDVLRGLQGVGCAATIPASLGILARAFPPGRARAIAFATFAAGAPIGGVFGNVFGALMTELTSRSWRSAFYLNCGIVLLSVIGAVAFFDRDEPLIDIDRRVDWIGAFLVTAGLVLIVFVLAQGEIAPRKWATSYIIALLVVGVLLLLSFVFWQYHLERIQNETPPSNCLPSPPPLMCLSMWTRAQGRTAVVMIIALLNWAAFTGWLYWVVLYYQDFLGLSPLDTAVRLLPMFVTGIILNTIFAIVVGRVSIVVLFTLGTCLTGCAPLLFALIDPKAPYWTFGFPSAILSVMGADFVFASGTLFVAKFSIGNEQSVAGAVFQTMAQIGTSIGVTVSTVVFNRVLVKKEQDAGISFSSETPLSDVARSIQLDAYRASQWTNFTFGMIAAALSLIFLRKVGIIGRSDEPSKNDQEKNTLAVTIHRSEEQKE